MGRRAFHPAVERRTGKWGRSLYDPYSTARPEPRVNATRNCSRWAASAMSGYGDDVSMSDFRPSQAESKDDSGHTSDGSVVNIPPRNEAFANGFSSPGMRTLHKDKVITVAITIVMPSVLSCEAFPRPSLSHMSRRADLEVKTEPPMSTIPGNCKSKSATCRSAPPERCSAPQRPPHSAPTPPLL